MRVKDSMEIEGPHGEQIAMVKKALITPVRERWVVKIKNGPDLEVKGNILDHEYTIGEGRDKVAEVSKKWFRLRDSYGVAIDPGQDDRVGARGLGVRLLAALAGVEPEKQDVYRPVVVPDARIGSEGVRGSLSRAGRDHSPRRAVRRQTRAAGQPEHDATDEPRDHPALDREQHEDDGEQHAHEPVGTYGGGRCRDQW